MLRFLFALALLYPVVLWAEDLPILKDGRWRAVVSPSGSSKGLLPKTEVTFCTDKATQPKLVNYSGNLEFSRARIIIREKIIVDFIDYKTEPL